LTSGIPERDSAGFVAEYEKALANRAARKQELFDEINSQRQEAGDEDVTISPEQDAELLAMENEEAGDG
jgi:hypothetical protein